MAISEDQPRRPTPGTSPRSGRCSTESHMLASTLCGPLYAPLGNEFCLDVTTSSAIPVPLCTRAHPLGLEKRQCVLPCSRDDTVREASRDPVRSLLVDILAFVLMRITTRRFALPPARPRATSISLSSSETATIDIGTMDRMWLSTESGSNVRVYYSDYPYSAFSGPITLANNIDSDDITVVTALPVPDPPKIGV